MTISKKSKRFGKCDIGCLVITGLIGLGLAGISYICSKEDNPDQSSIRYVSHPVDQVFRDHNGYRVFFSDNNQEYVEIKYYPGPGELEEALKIPENIARNFTDPHSLARYRQVKIFRDLEPKSRGIAHILKFRSVIGDEYSNVEIHMPKDSDISPGNETYGPPRHKIHSEMSEINENGIAREKNSNREK
jgi:hypothetical protein